MHAWLSIRAQGGTLVLRMEDIDPQRSKPFFADAIMEDLAWCGIDWDEGPVFQSNRMSRYQEAIQQLLDSGVVYKCYCTRKELRALAGAPHLGEQSSGYPGTCRALTVEQRAQLEALGRSWALRVRYPDQDIIVYDRVSSSQCAGVLQDVVLGQPTIKNTNCSRNVKTDSKCQSNRENALFSKSKSSGAFDSATVQKIDNSLPDCPHDESGSFVFSPKNAGGDFAICRSDGVIAYTLAVVVDDMDMGITEIVRGNDILAATPRQLVLHEFLGNKLQPTFGHVPLVLDAQGERLAKRHNGLQLRALRESGVCPEAIIGYFAWRAGLIAKPRLTALSDLIPGYSLERLSTSPVILPDTIQDVLLSIFD